MNLIGIILQRQVRKSKHTFEYTSSEATDEEVLCFSMAFYLQCCRDAHGDCHPRCPKIGLKTLSCPARWMGHAVGPLSDLSDLKVYLLIGQRWSSLKNHTVYLRHSLQSKNCAVPLLQSWRAAAETAAPPSQALGHGSLLASGGPSTASPTPLCQPPP